MAYPLIELAHADFPPLLREIPQPPEQLTLRGALPPPTLTLLSIVGSRKYTTYGKEAVDHLVAGLAGTPVGIVSGLALGIDSLAHEAALRHGLYTLAIPGSGLSDDVLYPRAHVRLARRILEAGGGLLSEFAPDFRATAWAFPQRNRLVAGISRATLLVEAAEKSGTLITARMATDYNRELLVVPGSIFSKTSVGTHQFLKLGATPVSSATDILEALRVDVTPEPGEAAPRPALARSPEEQRILDTLHEPKSRDELIRILSLPVAEASALLMQLEVEGRIVASNGLYRAAI